MKPPLTFLAIVVALTAAGCGGGTVIDPGAAEEDIRAGFAARDATVTSIDCPSDVDAEEGGTYECVAETSRGTFRVDLPPVGRRGERLPAPAGAHRRGS